MTEVENILMRNFFEHVSEMMDRYKLIGRDSVPVVAISDLVNNIRSGIKSFEEAAPPVGEDD